MHLSKKTSQPIGENALLSSQLEETNEGYALAKIISLKYCQHIKKKDKKNFISLMPANLYGEGDNFNLKSGHVLPALVKKFVIAKKKIFHQLKFGARVMSKESF